MDTTNFINALVKELKCASQAQLVKITKGRYGGTLAHWQIALAYAKYLSPKFHIAANKIIKRYIRIMQLRIVLRSPKSLLVGNMTFCLPQLH
ncbi:KilA-N domain-containing protein [Pseudodesulfovibrio senegalensis]|uniref:KilA-N domain-containing protein n=1 Tax=Pseudodesulfovibrio senegalensis TaxID=1721087 RepID=UPI003BA8B519